LQQPSSPKLRVAAGNSYEVERLAKRPLASADSRICRHVDAIDGPVGLQGKPSRRPSRQLLILIAEFQAKLGIQAPEIEAFQRGRCVRQHPEKSCICHLVNSKLQSSRKVSEAVRSEPLDGAI